MKAEGDLSGETYVSFTRENKYSFRIWQPKITTQLGQTSTSNAFAWNVSLAGSRKIYFPGQDWDGADKVGAVPRYCLPQGLWTIHTQVIHEIPS